jgi:hypothetical protein
MAGGVSHLAKDDLWVAKIQGYLYGQSMFPKSRATQAVTGLAILAIAISGCGGSSSSTPPTPQEAGKGEPSKQFLGPGEKNKLVEFGTEASAAEREAASAVLDRSFEARESGDFAVQCATLSSKGIEAVASKGASVSQCTVKLKKLAEPLAKTASFRKDKLPGEVTALRVKGDRGFALFHGTDGKDWVMPLEKEGGSWKVAAILEEELKPEPAKGTSSKKKPTEGSKGAESAG